MTGKRSEMMRTSDVYNTPRGSRTAIAARSAAPSPSLANHDIQLDPKAPPSIDIDLRSSWLEEALEDG